MKIQQDLLNRDTYLNMLIKIVDKLTNDGGSHSFAIDGKWGSGKSWILDRFERQLQGIGLNEDLEKAKGNYFVFHYNAWENDFYNEPLVAILSVIINKLNALNKTENLFKGLKKEAVDIFKGTLSKLTETLTGVNIFNIFKDIKEKGGQNTNFDKMVDIKSAINDVRNSLESLINSQVTIDEYGNVFPLIFIVDELDRCLPEYAIKVLERLHHVFNELPHCILILSIDKNQLGNAIKNIYGDDVNLSSYLNKFIDFSVQLDEGYFNTETFLNEFNKYRAFFEKDENLNYESSEKLLKVIFNGLSMRERIEVIRKAMLAHNLSINRSLSEKYFYFELFIAVLHYVQMHYYNNYKEYIELITDKYCYQVAEPRIMAQEPLKSLLIYFNKEVNKSSEWLNEMRQYTGSDDFFLDLFYIQYYLFVYKEKMPRARGSNFMGISHFYNVIRLLT